MASRKLTALPTATEVTTSDKIYIVDVSDTTESPQGTSKQALISELPSSGITSLTSTDGSIDIDLTDPSAPDLSIVDYAIPLAGTETGAPITGDLQVKDLDGEEFRLKYTDNNAEENGLGFQFSDAIGSVFQGAIYGNNSDGTQSVIGVESTNAILKIISPDLSPSLAYLQLEQFFVALKDNKIFIVEDVTEPKIGFFNKSEAASAQAAAIADATNATDVITQLNTLLAAMRAYGFISE